MVTAALEQALWWFLMDVGLDGGLKNIEKM